MGGTRGKVRNVRRTKAQEIQALKRTVRRLETALQAAAESHARELAALQRSTDRRLTAMMREIAELRVHEARAVQLERLMAERAGATQEQFGR